VSTLSFLHQVNNVSFIFKWSFKRHLTADIYTVNHKKGGSTFVIITLENRDEF